jgi:hypothetical protein
LKLRGLRTQRLGRIRFSLITVSFWPLFIPGRFVLSSRWTMLLTFKDLQQKKFTIEVDPSDSVSGPQSVDDPCADLRSLLDFAG